MVIPFFLVEPFQTHHHPTASTVVQPSTFVKKTAAKRPYNSLGDRTQVTRGCRWIGKSMFFSQIP